MARILLFELLCVGLDGVNDDVVLLERYVIPSGVAYGADVAACMRNYTRKVKRVTAFSSINGRSLPCLDAIQTDSTTTSEFEAVFKEGEFELR